nr:MAG TPA: hypothetical protein [Caudoviricetes sp.]
MQKTNKQTALYFLVGGFVFIISKNLLLQTLKKKACGHVVAIFHSKIKKPE